MSNKRKILVIENQLDQFQKIHGLLEEEYDVTPDCQNYVEFIDHVRIWVNPWYHEDYRRKALGYLTTMIAETGIEVIAMDYILGGSHGCKTGIALADALNTARKNHNQQTIPVLFLSKAERNNKNVLQEAEKFEVSAETRWTHKGYFGDEILEAGFFKKHVINEIKNLLSASELAVALEKLESKKTKYVGILPDLLRDINALCEKIQGALKANPELLTKIDRSLLNVDNDETQLKENLQTLWNQIEKVGS